MSAFNAFSSILSPSWKSMARRVLPSRLELKRRDGSSSEAPLAKVIFTTSLYVSPVQMMPACDHTGTPRHFHSSTTSGSACLMRLRMRASISPRQSPNSSILLSISREGESPPFLSFVLFFVFIAAFFLVAARLSRLSAVSPPLDHLPAVARGIAEAGVHGAVTVHGLLREFYASGAHLLVRRAAIVDNEHERRHGAFRHDLAHGLRGRRVERRRLRREQAELKGRLVRVLHGQPAVVAVPRVGMDAESQLLDIELTRFLLIADVQTDDANTLAHGASLSSDPFIVSSASRRRFSETAIVRPGRWAARRMQAGTGSSWCGAAFSRARSSPGLSPVTSRKVRPKVPRLFHPVSHAISMMERSVSRSSALARSIRRVSR